MFIMNMRCQNWGRELILCLTMLSYSRCSSVRYTPGGTLRYCTQFCDLTAQPHFLTHSVVRPAVASRYARCAHAIREPCLCF